LAVTDANLLLGRLIPDYFPKIFGKSENEPLDVDATRREFEKLAQNINENSANDFSLDEIIYGCVRPDAPNSLSLKAMCTGSSRSPTRPCVALYAR
jgi:N-methylhydantoinase A/oxoprolinase/acetone carboxylase beta subunit